MTCLEERSAYSKEDAAKKLAQSPSLSKNMANIKIMNNIENDISMICDSYYIIHLSKS